MTVSYTLKVAEARFGGFSGLLLRWRGSIYKLLYKEFLLFAVLYALLSITYRLLLTPEQRHVYAQVARYCNRSADLIPLSFVLGFYVTLVVNRWWAQYTSIPLPDQLMCVISASVHGLDQHGRLLRRTLVRYANLASVLVLRSVSTRVLKRFPTMEHVVDAGFMSQEERKKFESLKSDFNKYWVPCVWFTNLAAQARRDGRIRDDIALCLLLEELNKYRAKCSMLFHYDWISIPLVYTQLIDRNLQVSLLSVDDMYQNLPPAEKDLYWGEDSVQPPYTVATMAESLRPSFRGSTFNLRVSDDPEQSLQVEVAPGLARPVPAAQTPLLSRVLGAGAPSPAVSLRNFGCARGPPRTPRPLRSQAEEGGDPEAADCIEEVAGPRG
ncbi:bestrophin-4 isoform 5-T5 [Molossus nigricans]